MYTSFIAPSELELYSYLSIHLGPRFEAAGLRIQFHYNQALGIHFKVPLIDEYRGAILKGIEDDIARRYGWIESLKGSEISGQRHLDHKTRNKYLNKQAKQEFLDEIDQINQAETHRRQTARKST